MDIGISTASFFNKVPTESVFTILKEMRVGITEVFLNCQSEYEEPFVTELKKRQSGIKVHSVHALGTQFEAELFSINARVRADAEVVFKKVCRAGQILGANFYTFHGRFNVKKLKPEIDFIKMSDRLNQLCDIAREYDIMISYENVHWAFSAEPDFFTNILANCNNLATTLDTKQALLAGINPLKYFKEMGETISTVHICDIKNKTATTLPGKGKYDFLKLFKEIDKNNLSPPLLLEVYPKDYSNFDELRQSYDYIRALCNR